MVDFNLFKPRPHYGPEIDLSLVSKIIIENNKMKVIILSDESHTMILEISHNWKVFNILNIIIYIYVVWIATRILVSKDIVAQVGNELHVPLILYVAFCYVEYCYALMK